VTPRPAPVALAAVLLSVLMLVGLFVLPADAAPGRPPAAATAQIPNPVDWLFGQVFANPFKKSIRSTVTAALNQASIAFETPDVSTDARTRDIWTMLLLISDSLLLFLLVVGAIMVVAGDWTYLEAKELAPRALIAALSVNLSLLLLGQGIGISNLLAKGFLQVDPNSLTITFDRIAAGVVISPIVMALILLGALGLLLANIVRITAVVLLGIGGPILHVFGVLPQTDGIARGWWRAATACLLAPVVQSLLLTIAVKVFFGTGPSFVGHSDRLGMADMALLIVVVALMAYTPIWMLKTALNLNHRHMRGLVRGAGALAGVRLGY